MPFNQQKLINLIGSDLHRFKVETGLDVTPETIKNWAFGKGLVKTLNRFEKIVKYAEKKDGVSYGYFFE